jgi:hypothetical protein
MIGWIGMGKFATAVLLLASLGAQAAVTPSRMMANVFRFSEAGAVLEVCFASHAYPALPAEKAAQLRGLAERIAKLVRGIGARYQDDSLLPTYEATRDRIAGSAELKLRVKNDYQYCGERLATGMEKYVAENEALIGAFLAKPPSKAVQRRQPDPPPVK